MYLHTENIEEKKIPNNAAEKLRIAMVKQNDMRLSELAKKINCSAPNITNKFKRNNFSESDLRVIADVLGYDVEITLISRENGERI